MGASTVDLSSRRPLAARPLPPARAQGEVRLQQLFRNNQKASSYTEQLRGVLLGIRR